MKKRFFLYWLIVCVCETFFIFFLSSKIFFQIFRTNLTTSSISCHTSLTGTLVRSVLQSNNRLASLHGGIIKITFVLGGHFFTNNRPVKTLPLGQTPKGVKVVYDHVKVFLFIKVVDLEKILGYKAIAFTAF